MNKTVTPAEIIAKLRANKPIYDARRKARIHKRLEALRANRLKRGKQCLRIF